MGGWRGRYHQRRAAEAEAARPASWIGRKLADRSNAGWLVVIGALALLIGVTSMGEAGKFDQFGVRATATVTDVTERTCGGGPGRRTCWNYVIVFNTESAVIETTMKKEIVRLRAGSRINILYLSNDPHTVRNIQGGAVAGDYSPSSQRFFGWFLIVAGGAAVVAGAGGYFFVEISANRAVARGRDGPEQKLPECPNCGNHTTVPFCEQCGYRLSER